MVGVWCVLGGWLVCFGRLLVWVRGGCLVWFHTKYILCICLLVGSWWGMWWVGGGRLVWFPTKYKLCTHKHPTKHRMLVGSWWGSWWVGGGRLVHFPPNTNCAPTRTTPSMACWIMLGGDVWVHSWYLVENAPTNTNNPPITHQQNTHQNQQHREKPENDASGSWCVLGENPPR